MDNYSNETDEEPEFTPEEYREAEIAFSSFKNFAVPANIGFWSGAAYEGEPYKEAIEPVIRENAPEIIDAAAAVGSYSPEIMNNPVTRSVAGAAIVTASAYKAPGAVKTAYGQTSEMGRNVYNQASSLKDTCVGKLRHKALSKLIDCLEEHAVDSEEEGWDEMREDLLDEDQ